MTGARPTQSERDTDASRRPAHGGSWQADSFALSLRTARYAARMTQAELSEASGVALRTISDLERGFSQRPRRDTVSLLATALGLDGEGRAAFAAAARARRGRPTGGAGPAPPEFHGALVGRAAELAAGLAVLADPGARVLTLSGPGGVGKSRLAAELAARLGQAGIRFGGWLSLEGILDQRLADPAIEEAIRGAARPDGEPAAVVLDNFEQVAEAAGALPDLLGRAGGVRVIVTSRVPLGLSAEAVLPVPPLALPGRPDEPAAGDAAATAGSPAVALFIDRARRQQPGLAFDPPAPGAAANLAAAGAIAAALDGLPLAIELAAAQLAAFSLPALQAQVERSGIALLERGGPGRQPRQASMREAIRWSYDLLGPGEQALFRRLSVFSGGFTVAAASLLADDGDQDGGGILAGPAVPARLARLAAANMLLPAALPDESPEPRFAMLQTIRAYGLERLDRDPAGAEAARAAHLAWMRDLASGWRPGMSRRELNAWLDTLELERDNLRAALAWATASGRAADALALAADLGRLWDLRDHLREGMYWLERVVAAAAAADPPDEPPPLIWYWIGTLAVPLGERDRCREMGARLTAIAARTGDPATAARGAILTSLWLSETGDHAGAAAAAREAIAATAGADESRPSDLLAIRARAFNRLGVASHTEAGTAGAPALDAAAAAYASALRLCDAAGDESGVLNALAGLGAIGLARGEAGQAEGWFQQGLKPASAHRHWWYAWLMLLGLAAVHLRQGRPSAAARLLGAAEALERGRDFQPYAFWAGIRETAWDGTLAALGPAAFAAHAAEGRRAAHAAAARPGTLAQFAASAAAAGIDATSGAA
ncbi:MAG: ATP-binding protein [Chloroflexota bacterium]